MNRKQHGKVRSGVTLPESKGKKREKLPLHGGGHSSPAVAAGVW